MLRYQTGQRPSAVSNVTTGAALDLGTTYLVPFDANSNLVADDWESRYFPGGMDADADTDGDGLDNRSEYLCGTDPTNARSTSCASSTRPPAPTPSASSGALSAAEATKSCR
jgi:hypothetical protein